MYNGSGSWTLDTSWLDHRDSDWRALASQRWDGNVQDVEHSVPTLNPTGIADYVPDDPFTFPNELENYGYAVIEPVLSALDADYKGEDVRKEKFSYKAGLILRVEAPIATPDDPSTFKVTALRYSRTNPFDSTSPPVLDANGDPVEIPVKLPTGLIGDLEDTRILGVDPSKYELESDATVESYSIPASDVLEGMYDHRENVEQDLISINLEELTRLVDDNHALHDADDWKTDNPNGSCAGGCADYVPANDWNGVVYVEFPRVAGSGGRVDKVVQAKRYTDSAGAANKKVLALQLVNGSELPSPSYTSEIGLTVATNAPMYVVGNYNADGVAHPDDANLLDDPCEPPAALVSDALTILSNEWLDEHRKHSDHGSHSERVIKDTGDPSADTFVEIATAILTGLKPSIPNDPVTGDPSGKRSGGAHNFPRLLENWKNVTLPIRGSLVALFESEVHVEAMPDDFDGYYKAPNRDWGFNDNFRNGVYPPGSPNLRTYRRTAFQDLSRTEYDTAVAALWSP